MNQLSLSEQIKVHGIRSEEFASNQKNSFKIVVARAVTQLVSLIELAEPLLKLNGLLFAMKGNCTQEEESSAKEIESLLGMSLVDKKDIYIGADKIHRSIYTYKKVSEAEIKLPRRPGMAVKKPLA